MLTHQKGNTLLTKFYWPNKFFGNLSFSMVYNFWPFYPSLQVKFWLLAKQSCKKSNLVSISVVEIFFVLVFSVKRHKSLFTFESFCIILANSFFKNCLTCVKVQFLQQESKQTFPENLKFKKRDYHLQTEVVLVMDGLIPTTSV